MTEEAGGSTWLLNSWDVEILRLVLAWRQPVIFRPAFKNKIAGIVVDPEALTRRGRKPLKSGVVKPGETRINHRVNCVFGHLLKGGLVERTRDTVVIIDREGVQAILDAGQVVYPRRGEHEAH